MQRLLVVPRRLLTPAHQAYNCRIDGKLVTSAASFGRVITRVNLSINRTTDQVVSKTATNGPVTRDVDRDAAVTAIIDRYNRIAGPIRNRVVGSQTADLTRATNAAGESLLGDVIADAQLEATAPTDFGGAVIAFMLPRHRRGQLHRLQPVHEPPWRRHRPRRSRALFPGPLTGRLGPAEPHHSDGLTGGTLSFVAASRV